MANQEYAILMCTKCGNIVRVIRGGPGTVTCCNVPMKQINNAYSGG